MNPDDLLMCDRCGRERARRYLRKIVGLRVTVWICRTPCEFVR